MKLQRKEKSTRVQHVPFITTYSEFNSNTSNHLGQSIARLTGRQPLQVAIHDVAINMTTEVASWH